MTDKQDTEQQRDTQLQQKPNKTSCKTKSHRLPPSAYRELSSSGASSGRVSPALQRARMAVEQGREFRSEAKEAVASSDKKTGYQSDDELTLALTDKVARDSSDLKPLPRRPASALAGQIDIKPIVKQSQQENQLQKQEEMKDPQSKSATTSHPQTALQSRIQQASLDELFAKYPSIQASFKLLPPNKQQEQWCRLFELLDSQQAAVTAWRAAQHSDQIQQMRSRVRRELSEERLLLDRRLANHSRLTNEAAGSSSRVPFETRKTAKPIDKPRLQLEESLEAKHPRPVLEQRHETAYQADYQRLQQQQQQLLHYQTEEWRSIELHGQLSELSRQLADSRREVDWLRQRLDEVNNRVDELLTENFRLKARLSEATSGESRSKSPSPNRQWSQNRSRSDRSHAATAPLGQSNGSTNLAGLQQPNSTVAAIRQSLAELERRNLIDRSPTRLRSIEPKAAEKEKSSPDPSPKRSSGPRQHQHSNSEDSYGKMRSGRVHSAGRYIFIRS